MDFMSKLKTCPKTFLFLLVSLILGGLLLLVGIAAPYWAVTRDVNSGLWVNCPFKRVYFRQLRLNYDCTKSRVYSVLGFISAFTAGIQSYQFIICERRRIISAFLTSGLCSFSAGLDLASVIVLDKYLPLSLRGEYLAHKVEITFGWALYIFCVGTGLIILAGILGLITGCKLLIRSRQNRRQNDPI